MKHVTLQAAYVLHRRAYRENSFLVELFTVDYGRMTAIARGVRKVNSSMQGLLQAFMPLLISWSGSGELMTLTQVELRDGAKPLSGENLFAGFYLNELLMCLLHKWDAHSGIFNAYERAILALQTAMLEQKTLRSFEKNLLEELGYGPLPKIDISLHTKLLPDQYYRFTKEQGFVLTEITNQAQATVFSGKSLLAIANEDWDAVDSLPAAKRLTRLLLASLLGSRPIHSRRLFTHLRQYNKQ